MRLAWAVGAGAAVGAAACVLPAATVLSGTGGQPSGSSSGSSSGISSGAGPMVTGIALYTYPSGTGLQVAAPSGTPGQRHLFHAVNSWWILYATTPDTIIVGSMSDAMPGTWDTGQSMGLSYSIGSNDAIDGRTFGVDLQVGVPSGEPTVVHVSLSSLAFGTPKVHGRGVITPGALAFDVGSPSPIGTLTTGSSTPDGVVAAVSTTPPSSPLGTFDALDFGLVLGADAGAPTPAAAIVLPDPPGDAGVAAATATSLDDSGTLITTRAALPLGHNLVAIWNESSAGLVAKTATLGPSGAAWPASSTSVSQAATVSGRAWAACATSGTQRAVVAWSDDAGVFHASALQADTGSAWAPIAAPETLHQPPADLFVACGASRVYAFVVSPADGSILWSTSTPTLSGWSGWSTLVEKPPASSGRCYLSGYDRVASVGSSAVGQIGLLWTEGASCSAAPPAPSLMVALAPAADP